MSLSDVDFRALIKIEREAATGHTHDALLDLRSWRDSSDRVKEKDAVAELQKSGVLGVLGVENWKDNIDNSHVKSIDKKRAADLATFSEAEPIDHALYQAAWEDMSGVYNAPKSWGNRYEDKDSLTQLQKSIEDSRPAEPIANALMKPDESGKILFDKLADSQGAVTVDSVRAALQTRDDLSAEERQSARSLLRPDGDVSIYLSDGVTPLTAEKADDEITKDSLSNFLKLHPTVPPDLTPPDAAPAQAAPDAAPAAPAQAAPDAAPAAPTQAAPEAAPAAPTQAAPEAAPAAPAQSAPDAAPDAPTQTAPEPTPPAASQTSLEAPSVESAPSMERGLGRAPEPAPPSPQAAAPTQAPEKAPLPSPSAPQPPPVAPESPKKVTAPGATRNLSIAVDDSSSQPVTLPVMLPGERLAGPTKPLPLLALSKPPEAAFAPLTSPSSEKAPHKHTVVSGDNYWDLAFKEVTGHDHTRKSRWSNAQNEEILGLVKAMKAKHQKGLHAGDVIEIPSIYEK